jgi:predicted permease
MTESASGARNALDSLIRDFRYGIRTLARTPGFSVIAILVMALGIGANVALFTVVHSVLLKPLSYPDSGHIVRIYEADTHNLADHHTIPVSGADFLDWQKQQRSFSQMGLLNNWNSYGLSGSGGQLPEQVMAQTGTANVFSIFGVHPALGRLFAESDDRADAPATVVLRWSLWKRRFGGDTGIVGQTIRLDAKPYTVIGVLPAWFNYPNPTVQLWTPLRHEVTWPGFTTSHGAHNFMVIARLKPGVSIAQAQADVSAVQSSIRKQFPEGPVFDAVTVMPLLESRTFRIKTALYALLAATGCLLMIACLNIANLLVARAAARRKEAAIRTALGGSRGRLIREQVVESILLCVAGGALGLMFASLTLQWLVHVRSDMPRVEEIHLDGIAVLFGLGIMLFCGLMAGLIPALSLDEKQLLRTLQESARSHSGGQARVRLRRVLLTLEVALTIVLLISAGLLVKSYQHLHSVDLGVATRNVLTMGLSLPEATYKKPPQVLSFHEELLEKVRASPGVRGAGLASELPGHGNVSDHTFVIHENPPLPQGKYLDANVREVDPGFFNALEIPVVRGRVFQSSDRLENANVAVVTPSFVREFFPNSEPIGRHIDDDNFEGPHSFEIVGIVGDTRESVAQDVQPTMYFPLYRGDDNSVSLAIRTRSNPESFALPVQKIIAQMDPGLAVSDVLTMDQIIGKSTLDANFDATLLMVFALLSLVLAAVGLFGVLSYIVAQRQGEIGIRIALGAQRDDVLRLMLADGLRPAIFGLVLGLAASAAATRLIRSLLYGTEPLDPMVFVLVSLALLAVAAIACLVPAWRASRLDPMEALRTE